MGMYDYLGGEQIKIFYRPIFSNSGMVDDGPGTWHSGGGLRSFDEQDDLPLKTLYYKYPDNFLVYDYLYDREDVWVIKNGRLNKFVSYKLLNEEDIIGPVFDYYGRQLDISTLGHFQEIKDDFNNLMARHREIEKSFFPNGVIDAVKNNRELYEKNIEAYDKARDENSERFRKWLPKDIHSEVKDFGEAFDCYLFHRERKDDEPIANLSGPMEDYLECLAYISKMIQNNPEIVLNYFNWIDNKKMLSEVNFEAIIDEIKTSN